MEALKIKACKKSSHETIKKKQEWERDIKQPSTK